MAKAGTSSSHRPANWKAFKCSCPKFLPRRKKLSMKKSAAEKSVASTKVSLLVRACFPSKSKAAKTENPSISASDRRGDFWEWTIKLGLLGPVPFLHHHVLNNRIHTVVLLVIGRRLKHGGVRFE